MYSGRRFRRAGCVAVVDEDGTEVPLPPLPTKEDEDGVGVAEAALGTPGSGVLTLGSSCGWASSRRWSISSVRNGRTWFSSMADRLVSCTPMRECVCHDGPWHWQLRNAATKMALAGGITYGDVGPVLLDAADTVANLARSKRDELFVSRSHSVDHREHYVVAHRSTDRSLARSVSNQRYNHIHEYNSRCCGHLQLQELPRDLHVVERHRQASTLCRIDNRVHLVVYLLAQRL